MVFGKIPCVASCEICFTSNKCQVCQTGHILNVFGTCDLAVNDPDKTFEIYARNWIQGIRQVHEFSGSVTDIELKRMTLNRLKLRVDLNAVATKLVNPTTRTCSFTCDAGYTIGDTIYWKFNDKNFIPYTEIFFALENSMLEFDIWPISFITSISEGTCRVNSMTVYFYDSTCFSDYYNYTSLKGFIVLKFCNRPYLDFEGLPYMILPLYTYTYQPDDYGMIIPGTNGYIKGKCQNGCKCWDGIYNTTKGYNSCLPDDTTGQTCPNGSRLINLSMDGSRQVCMVDSELEDFEFCD